jgi:hypothetical protein
VPPPNAAKNATTHTPTASSFLHAASISPDKAKAAWLTDQPAGEGCLPMIEVNTLEIYVTNLKFS